MVMMAVNNEDLSWFRKLGRFAGKAVEKSPFLQKTIEKITRKSKYIEDPMSIEYRAFELADAMEQGLAKELTTAFIKAPAPPTKEKKVETLLVHRSDDRAEHVLTSMDGEPLLIAKGLKGGDPSRIDIFVPTGGDPPVALGPAFTLAMDDYCDDTWTLTAERCECCEYLPPAKACYCGKQGRRELAHIRHFRETIGGGSAMCMEVDLPALRHDSSPEIWCTRTGTCNDPNREIVTLESRRPRWNSKLSSLVMSFWGRCSCASAKNFQLQTFGATRTDKEQDVELLFGKTGPNAFVLDYRRPLGMVQAFAVALSTASWK
eukprot:gnl/MRDRNA2_/MRDRNA2_109672_c0_seq1.p1 gnl/MRDRNA2_/MRDRNA2_109672_c0~~gnl/MRDRNA2_/MRDRNA2_109672_c0_seq1.p1  ORF type:complete len:318 (+),score=71.99 gnl/MRDRNA2_/MRDRNA2_109672_c0_seq1:101-1054(+)